MSKKFYIDLELHESDATKVALSDLRTSFKQSGEDVNTLNKKFSEMYGEVENAAALEKEYDKIINARISAKDKEINKIIKEREQVLKNNTLSEAEKKTQLEKLELRIKQLSKSKQELREQQKATKDAAKRAKLEKAEAAARAKMSKWQVARNKLETAYNKLLEQRAKLMAKLDKPLKAAKAVGGVAAKAAGIAAKGYGAAAGLAGAAFGMVTASAQAQADKDAALRSLKSGVDKSVVDSVYIKTGADYSTIVAAINNVSSLSKNPADITAAATLEVQNPGAGALLLSRKLQDSSDITRLAGAINAIKAQTGAQDISGAISAAMKSRAVTRGDVSQRDYILAYSKLTQAGMSEEEANRAITSIGRKGGDFIENLNNADLLKYTYDKQLRNRLAAQDLSISSVAGAEGFQTSEAESTAEKMRTLQLKKDELVLKLLPVVNSILDALVNSIDDNALSAIADGFVKLFKTVLPLLPPLIELAGKVMELLEPALDIMTSCIKWIVEGLKPVIEWFTDDDKTTNDLQRTTDTARVTYNVVQNYAVNGAITPAALAGATADNEYIKHSVTARG